MRRPRESGAAAPGKEAARPGLRLGRVAPVLVLVAGAAGLGMAVRARSPEAPPVPVSLAVPPVPAAIAPQERAYAAAALAARQHPEDAALALEAGGLAGDLGRHETALRWFRAAAARDPRLLPAITGQGQMWMALGWPGRAAAAYERALKLLPDEPQILLELARAFVQLRDLDRALEYARRAEKRRPGDAEIHRALATVHGEREEPDESLRHAASACAARPQDPQNWVMQGQLLLRNGRYADAETSLRRGLALDPAEPVANVTLARVLTAARKDAATDREAFALLARARVRAPQDPLALFLQGEIAARAGQGPLSLSLLRQARELAPGDPAILRALGQALTRAGRLEEGVRLGAASQALGPRGTVFPDLESTTKRVPDPRNTVALADLYRRQDLLEAAVWVLERGLRRTPGDARLQEKLAAVRSEIRARLPAGLED